MSKKLSKFEAQKQIKEFFSDVKNKTPKQVKKIKKLAMSQNISLGKLRKTFCKKCFVPYKKKNPKVRIKNKIKSVTCRECGYIVRWKLKN